MSGAGRVAVRVERRSALGASPEEVARLYGLYEAAFGPLRVRAAARHVLTHEEFAEEMADERVDKYVALDPDGAIVGISTFTNQLDAIVWISPEFYAARFPEESARDAVYYLGFTLVDPRFHRHRAFESMVETIVERLRAERAVCVWDMCSFNRDELQLEAGIVAILDRSGGATMSTLDTQTYVAADFQGR
ncbi:hypothetical protein [Nocardioides zeae]|uniref:GNAT family N-acetyltransferase n=1 Tax=Nocardioides zeae TaxID=1457234 RepID=A0A6P0HH80_9ACTN|nr:hypothetical protein [Nocardioides zeae]NEN77998.1 hypothetical protein [Nocardioides zeae]